MPRPVTTFSGVTIAVDLGTRDFEGFRADSLELADVLTPEWTDRSELDIGVTLVELFAFMSDNLSYYQDRIGNEGLFPSAVQRRSIIEHSRLIGYELRAAVSATVDMTIVTNAAGVAVAGTQIEVDTQDGSDPATFELLNDFTAAGAGTTVDVVAIEGTSVSETVGSSDGTSGQRFTLAQTPLSLQPNGDSSLQLFVAEGGPPELWVEVANFLESSPTDKVYEIEIDENDVVEIFFGDGVNGKIPASGVANITAAYRVGGGRSGNQVGTNKLTKFTGLPFIDSMTNPAQPSGGRDKETIEEAKELAPQSLKALDRAVTHGDYRTLARKVPGVAKALAYRGAGAYEEIVVIAAAGSNPVPSGSWDPFLESGTGLLGATGDFLTIRKTTPVILNILPAQVSPLLVEMLVHVLPKFRRADVSRLVEDAVFQTFDLETGEFGQVDPLSQVSDVVEDVTGVDYVDLQRLQRQPYGRQLGSPAGDPTFGSFVIGLATPRQKWKLFFTSPTAFTVTGDALGLQIATGTLGVPYTTDDGGFGFTVTAGGTPAVFGDQWQLATSPFLANVFLDRDELSELFGGLFTLTLTGGLG